MSTNTTTNNTPLRVLTLRDLRAKGIPWSRVHIGRLIKLGEFPAPFRLGKMTICWREDVIDAWILQCIAGGNKIDEHARAVAVKAALASAAARRKA
jgi:prophage regulatory protein